MPQIIITTDARDGAGVTEVHRERVSQADFETETASLLLVERIGWALSDADQLEQPPQGATDGREAHRIH